MKTPALPRRLKRSESFLGIHFDFHAGEDCHEIGKRTTPAMIERIIRLVKPDYLQCDCKGHRGLCSYPTKIGHRAPGIIGDPLRVWREVTARRGVALYLHYSGVWDSEAVRRHPSWARIDEQSRRDQNGTSVFGPYVDRLLIPQLKELAGEYGIDGMWIDGECWALNPDYGRKAIEAFRRKTGIRRIPRRPQDPHYREFAEFCRNGFRRYLGHYVDTLHRDHPNFQIASNWAFTSFMPEPVSIDVDFLSGDYSMQDSVNTARLEARCLARQGKPWDLMAWGFSGAWEDQCRSTKSAVQLQREAAIVLAQGGGFQIYFQQKRDGSIFDWQMKVMAEVARFCRARQPFCHRAEAVPQIGLIYSGAAFYRKTKRLFSPWEGELTPLSGILNCLLDSQLAVEIVMEHHLRGRLHEYPLLVWPEWEYVEPRIRRELLAYVRAGGNLLVIGPAAAASFRKELGVRFNGPARERSQWLAHEGALAGVKSPSRQVKLRRGDRPFGRFYFQNDPQGSGAIAASISRYGRGRIAGVYLDVGARYRTAGAFVVRDFLQALVHQLFPEPVVEVTGSHAVDVTLMRLRGKVAVNLINTAGPHANKEIQVFDEIPPVGPLAVSIRIPRKPRKVTLAPAGTALPFTYSRGKVKLTLPRLEIHHIILVE